MSFFTTDLAQLVEHYSYKVDITGSIPVIRIVWGRFNGHFTYHAGNDSNTQLKPQENYG